MRTERGLVRETGRKRLSYRPIIFAKKLQKSREIYNFTAFCGGPNRDRTDDLTDANRTLSQLSYRPIFGCFVYFCSICLCSLLFWPGPCYVALALPAELWAHIAAFCGVFTTKSRFSSFSILEDFGEKSLRNRGLKLTGRCAAIGMRTERSPS